MGVKGTFMKKAVNALMILLLAVVLWFGLSGMYSVGYESGGMQVFEADRPNGQKNILKLLPGNEMLILKGFQTHGMYEVALFHITGIKGKHLVGPLWTVGHGPFSFRLYESETLPYRMEFRLLNKHRENLPESLFGDVGTRASGIFLFRHNRLKAGGFWYDKVDFPEARVEELMQLLK